MKICYLVVLLVLFAPTMTYRLKNIKAIKMTTKQKCEKIKCPPIDDPVCVKIKNKHKKEVYIIAINKCEMKYASCHKDVVATVVPMVNCLHVKKDPNITSKRIKRDVDDSAPGKLKIYYNGQNNGNLKLKYQTEDSGNEDPKLLKGRSDDSITEEAEVVMSQSDDSDNDELLKGEETGSSDDDELLKGKTEDKVTDEKVTDEKVTDEKVTDEKVTDENVTDEKVTDEKVTNEKVTDEKVTEEDQDADKVTEEDQDKSVFDTIKSEEKLKKKASTDDVDDNKKKEIDENDVSKLVSLDNVGPDYEQLNEKADLVENKKNCPTVCPSRDVMVCAKCKHNIHRTFLSTCHLRMFACKHTSEKLQLVKREPCVQSAPIMSEFKETKGRIPESGELDEVHKFIFCRDKNLKDDPRCRFGTEDK